MEEKTTTNNYPVLLLRIKAMCIDSMIFIVLLFLLMYVVSILDISSPILRIGLMFGPLILIEPVLISMTGGSIGHHFAKIKVVSQSSGNNISFVKALPRVLAKYLLGFYSVITMYLTKRRQAVHDVVSGSLVVFKNESNIPERYKLQELQHNATMPSLLRRIVITAIYLLFLLLLLGVFLSMAVTPACMDNVNACSSSETTTETISVYFWIALAVVTLVIGLKGYLPGARAGKHENIHD